MFVCKRSRFAAATLLFLTLSGSASAAPDLVIEDPALNSSRAAPGETLTASGVVKNVGSSAAGRSKVKFYLSENTTLGPTDSFLKAALVAPLDPGETSPESGNFTLPAGTTPGTWFVLVQADSNEEVSESNEANNVSSVALTVTGPDLTLRSQQVSPGTVVAGGSLTASFTVENQGEDSAASNRLYFYLSTNPSFGSSDELLAPISIPPLAAGASRQLERDLTIPEGIASGTWYLLFRLDPNNEILESDEGNNLVSSQLTIAAPDLSVENEMVSSSSVSAGDTINASCRVRNIGAAASPQNKLFYYLSSNPTYSTNDAFLKADVVLGMAPGSSVNVDANVTIPETTSPGTWYILYRADPSSELDEPNEANNLGSRVITVGATPSPDLLVLDPQLDRGTVEPSETVQASVVVKNVGEGVARSSYLKYYLSQDGSFDGGDTFLELDGVSTLAPGASSAENASVVIPSDITAGTWHLLFRADANSQVDEADESNNVSSALITVGGTSVFNDLPSDHWAYGAALYLFQEGLLEPDGGHVRPDDAANRAELAKLAFLGAEIPPLADEFPCPFNDLQVLDATTSWYYRYAKNLSYLEFGDGYSPFTRDRFNFYPSDTITRAHALKVLIETWDVPLLSGGSLPYADVPTSHDAFNWIYTAYNRGLIDAGATHFRPDDAASRAEIFVMLHNLMVGAAIQAPAVVQDDFFPAGNYTPANLGLRRTLANGNFQQYAASSFYIPGFHLPLVFEHRYQSFLTELPDELFPLRPLGHGWSHSYNAYIVTLDDHLVVVWPDGAMHVYRDTGAGIEHVTEGVYNEIHRPAPDRFTITTKGQVVYTFEKLGGTAAGFPFVLKKIQDRNNKSIGLFYEPSQRPDRSDWRRLWKVTGTAGRSLYLSYHPGSDLLRSVTDPLNRQIQFDFTAYEHETADLKEFIDAEQQKTRYSYNQETPGHHLLRYVFLPDNKVVTNQYRDRKLASTQRGNELQVSIDIERSFAPGASAFERFTLRPSDDRAPVIFETRRDGRPTRISGAAETDVTLAYEDPAHPTLPTSVLGADGIPWTLGYDERGNVLSVEGPLGYRESFTYNTRNDPLTYTDARNKVTEFGYDAVGNLSSIEDPLQRTTVIDRYASGLVERVTSPSNVAVSYRYDAYGNATEVSAPLGISTSASYDLAGRPTEVTDPRDIVTRFAFDANDNLEVVEGPTATSYRYTGSDLLEAVTDPVGGITRLDYNNENQLESMSFQGRSIDYTYFEDGRISGRTDPDGVRTTFVYDDYGRLTSDNVGRTYTWDGRGRLGTATNALGTVTFGYDELNRLSSVLDPFGQRVSYTHDAAGNVETITYPGNRVVGYTYYDDGRLESVEDWLGNLTSYFYRPDGQLERIDFPNGIDADYGYDAAGRLTSLSYMGQAGVLASYDYVLDAAGQHKEVTRVQPLDDAPSASSSLTMTYDEHNRIQSANGAAFEHDLNGRLTAKGPRTFTWDRHHQLTGVGGDVDLSFSYDALGHRREKRDDGVTTRYVLDHHGGTSHVLMETDAAGNPKASYIYGLGLVARIDETNGVRYYLFDSRGSTVAMVDAAQQVTHSYAYSPYGKLERSVEQDANPYRFVGRFGVQHDRDELYFMRARYYDPSLGRFLSADPIWSTNLYRYADGNPVMMIDPLGTSAVVHTLELLLLIGKAKKIISQKHKTPEQAKHNAASIVVSVSAGVLGGGLPGVLIGGLLYKCGPDNGYCGTTHTPEERAEIEKFIADAPAIIEGLERENARLEREINTRLSEIDAWAELNMVPLPPCEPIGGGLLLCR